MRLTTKEPSGKWSLRGVDLQALPPEVYGALCKLLAYEDTGLDPDEVERMKDDAELLHIGSKIDSYEIIGIYDGMCIGRQRYGSGWAVWHLDADLCGVWGGSYFSGKDARQEAENAFCADAFDLRPGCLRQGDKRPEHLADAYQDDQGKSKGGTEMNENNNAAEREKMEVEDLASMLCASISAQMLITMEHDKIKVEGGTALHIVDMYMIIKALEEIGKHVLPMMQSEEALRERMKKIIDKMHFTEEELK